MAFLDRLREVFETVLPGVIVHKLGRRHRGSRIHATLEWVGFEHLDMLERQNLVWDRIEPFLTKDQQRSVGLLMTFTPYELQALELD